MLTLFWVRRHLNLALALLLSDDPTLALSEVHHHLDRCHHLLHRLLPRSQQTHPARWEKWSLMLFHYRKDEVVGQVREAQQLLQHKAGPEDIRLAQQGLLKLHIRMRDASDSNAG